MFNQLLTPVGDSLGLSFLVAILPVVALLVLLGVLAPPGLAGRARRPRRRPRRRRLRLESAGSASRSNSVANGAVFALWPVMWIVVNALLLYNVAVQIGPVRGFSRLGHRASAQ